MSRTRRPHSIGEDLGLHDEVCTEGGNSGEHCAVAVNDLSYMVPLPYGPVSEVQTIQATQVNGTVAGMVGDSGGPVMSLVNTTTGEVRAAGMIQSGTGSLPQSQCGAAYQQASCSAVEDFSSMRV